MKKTILSIAIVGLMGVASTSWSYTNPTAGLEDLVQTDGTKSEEVAMPVIANNPEVTKSLTEFKALLEQYGPALKAQDQAKSQEFGTKMQTWSQGVATWMPKLSPEEQQKVGTYIQSLVQKYMPQPAAPAAAPAAPASDTPK